MNQVHLHLLLNHVAILGSLFGLLLLAAGLIRKSEHLIQAALVTLVLSALATIPVFLTGEPAEEAVEHLAGVAESAIEEHEELAEIAIWAMQALGLLSLITFWFRATKRPMASMLTTLTLIASLFAFGIMAKVGLEGGKIRHTELSSSAAPSAGSENKAGDNGEDRD